MGQFWQPEEKNVFFSQKIEPNPKSNFSYSAKLTLMVSYIFQSGSTLPTEKSNYLYSGSTFSTEKRNFLSQEMWLLFKIPLNLIQRYLSTSQFCQPKTMFFISVKKIWSRIKIVLSLFGKVHSEMFSYIFQPWLILRYEKNMIHC